MFWYAPLLAFSISVVFVPYFQGAATSPRWALAALSLYWLEWFTWPFIAYLFMTLSFDQAMHWSVLVATLCWGMRSGRSTVMWTIMAFSTGVAISGLVAMGQSWYPELVNFVPQLVAPGGLFLNKNVMGDAAVLALVALLSITKYWTTARQQPIVTTIAAVLLVTLVSTALVLSREKSAWLALGVGVLLLAPSRWRWWAASFCILALLALKLGGFDFRLHTLEQRFWLWNQAIQQLTWFGNGTYDFATVTIREPNLHNDWLQAVWELGVVGFVIPGVCLVAALRGGLGFVGALFVLGSFTFPLHMPASGWFAAFMVGSYLRCDDERSRMVRVAGMAHQQLQRP